MPIWDWFRNPDKNGGSFFCGQSDRGGNVEKDHPNAKIHSCILEPDHRNVAGQKTKHRCNCGWEWKNR